MKRLFRKIFGYCGYCNRWFVYPKTRRRNTAFVDDSMNYMRACSNCHQMDYDEYEELWQDYWASRL